ncbi:peptidase M23 [Corallococcus sp. AB004]|uniref:peptidase M23 n=1 Tax=Corallococcus TaxID=83461 RepID=UPI000EA303FA|nr:MULTISPECIES: peptidase M23 [Corallococcus]RKI35619.1 peptidase M23 [Corallococcus sp. AB004]MBN8466392.1 peptidase M23 [Corallococcus exiguus]NPC74886.1 peptidase M23 [Corallococcus exiguus]NPD28374.1 peptidase M23 [Corallococcus exiguus]NRD48986.1 peptidase M23 [Corallococcus exiguus]
MKLKTLLSAGVALAAAAWASPGVAATANGPICDPAAYVNSTTYYNCTGSSHTALDIGNGSCGEWNHRGMLVGNYYYYYYGGCAAACYGSTCNGGAGNYYVVSGASGWDFRQLHFYANVSSGTKTCDRCALGLVGGTGSATGPHVHADNRQYGTRKSAWYTSVGTTCGTNANCTNRLGVPTL